MRIRVPQPDELAAFLTAVEAAFGHESSDEDARRFSQILETDRCLVVDEAGAFIGTAGAYSLRLAIPGGEADAAGVTMIGVLPTHRRRGLLTQMMRLQLDDVAARGEPIAVLWASEAGIYQRYGYGLASVQGNISIERNRALWLEESTVVGRPRFVDVAEAVKLMPEAYDRVMATRPGMFARSVAWWEAHLLVDTKDHREGAGPMQRVVFEDDGRVHGYALYRTRTKWPEGFPAGQLEVIEAVGVSAEATRAVWSFLFGVDLMDRVRAWHLPLDHPLQWMLREPDRLRFTHEDSLWLRVIDVAGALGARSYSSRATLTFEISDALLPANAGRWRLEADPPHATVERTDDEPELVMDVRDLGTVYLSGTTFRALADAGRVIERVEGAIAGADAAFHWPVAPWCPEVF